MKKVIEYIKGKSLYILLGVVLLLIIVIAISSCSSGGTSSSYQEIENKMVKAAKKYYAKHSDLLPKEVESTVKVSTATLIDSGLLKEIYDVKNRSNRCSGYVETTKVDVNNYSYIPFLTCKGNYEPKYLKDEILNSKNDEYSNGVYLVNNEYIYRGDLVNNYIKFNGELWRIIKVDLDGDIKLISNDHMDDKYSYDDAYNSVAEENFGITTDYTMTSIRKTLNDYYKVHFSDESKAKIVSKNLCIAPLSLDDEYSREKECQKVKEAEKIGLINATDYKYASLSNECNKLADKSCSNYNYLSTMYTLILNPNSDTNYKSLFTYYGLETTHADSFSFVRPVIYLKGNIMVLRGTGSSDDPYIIK